MKITPEQLVETLRLHGIWLRGEEGGERADLRRADLRRADLRRADLRRADLRGADLGGADLIDAEVGFADLSDADLSGAGCAAAQLGPYRVAVTATHVHVGCVRLAIGDLPADDDTAGWAAVHAEAPYWWERYGQVVRAMIAAAQADAPIGGAK